MGITLRKIGQVFFFLMLILLLSSLLSSLMQAYTSIDRTTLAITSPLMILSAFLLIFSEFRAIIDQRNILLGSLLLWTLASLFGILNHEGWLTAGNVLTENYPSLKPFHLTDEAWYWSLVYTVSLSAAMNIYRSFFEKHRMLSALSMVGMMCCTGGLVFHVYTTQNGFIYIKKGDAIDTAYISESDNTAARSIKVSYTIEMNDISSSRLQPGDLRIAVSEISGDTPANPHHSGIQEPSGQSEIMKMFPLQKDKIYTLPKSGLYFRLNEFYPDFGFAYDYPKVIDTIPPRDPGIMLELEIGNETAQLQLRTLKHPVLQDPHFPSSFEFYWETPDELLKNRESAKYLSSVDRIVFIGTTQQVYFINDQAYSSEVLVRNENYTSPSPDSISFVYQFIFPDGKYISSQTTSLSDLMNNPVAKIEAWGDNWNRSDIAYLYQSPGGRSGFYDYPGEGRRLTLVEDERSIAQFSGNWTITGNNKNESKTHSFRNGHWYIIKGTILRPLKWLPDEQILVAGYHRLTGITIVLLGVVLIFPWLLSVLFRS